MLQIILYAVLVLRLFTTNIYSLSKLVVWNYMWVVTTYEGVKLEHEDNTLTFFVFDNSF